MGTEVAIGLPTHARSVPVLFGCVPWCSIEGLLTTGLCPACYLSMFWLTTTTTQYKLQYVHTVYAQVLLGKDHQRGMQRVTTTSAGWVFVLVCASALAFILYPLSFSCWNEKYHQRKLLKVRGTGHQHPSAQIGVGCSNNTTCTWAQLWHKCPCASCMFCCILL